MFGSSFSETVTQSLTHLEFYLTNYSPDSQNIISGYLPKINSRVYVLAVELTQIVSLAYEKSRNSAKMQGATKGQDFQAYESLRKKLLAHVQHKKSHYSFQSDCKREGAEHTLSSKGDTEVKENLNLFGQIEDFLWLMGLACDRKLDDGIIVKEEIIEKLTQKLFEDLAQTTFLSSCKSGEVRQLLERVKKSYSQREYKATVEAITTVRQQIGCP